VPDRQPLSIADALANIGAPPTGQIASVPIGRINQELFGDKAGFFDSLISAGTKEMIGMKPDPSVERYRAENPVRGFTSQVLPELALFAIPGTKVGALAVKNFRPAAALVEYGAEALKAGRAFKGRALTEVGHILPVLGARQAASLVAPEEGSFSRIAERNTVDILFGGAFAGTAEFLKNLRGASALELRTSGKDPERTLALIQKYFKDYVDVNNPPQDQLASLLRLEADPQHAGHPVMADVRRGIDLMRAEVLKQEKPAKQAWVKLAGGKSNKAIAKLFKRGVPLIDLPEEFPWRTMLPKDFEAFTRYPKALTVTEPAERSEVWRAINENLTRMDADTFIGQEGSEGLYVVVKKVQSIEDKLPGANRLFVGRPDIPDRYFVLKTNKPWEFVDDITRRVRKIEDVYAYDSTLKQVSEDAFLDSRLPNRGPRTFQLEDGVEVSAMPGTTPTFDAIRRDVELAKPWQKGLYGLVEAGDQLETPQFFKRVLDQVSKTVPVSIPFSSFIPQMVKDFSFEAGHLIRESARASRKILAPAAMGNWNGRAAVLNRLTGQAFHRMLGRARQVLWGQVPDEVIMKGNILKNLMLRMHDPRTGGILTKAVYALDSPENLEQLTVAWRMRWTPDEAAKNGISSKVVQFLRDLNKHDLDQILELKASRSAAGVEDDFIPLASHYSMSRMWPGKFRVELYDDLTGDLVGYAGGHSPRESMKNAEDIVRYINSTAKEGEPKLRTPIRDHISTTEHVHFSKELATTMDALAKEVDAFQRGAKISANNLLTQRVVSATQRLMMDEPGRFLERSGAIGWTGQFKPLTIDEVLESITANTVETQRLITKESLVSQLTPEIEKLMKEYPDLYNQWVVRFNSHLGYQGPVAKAIDRMIDVPLSRFMGSHGGSRAIRKMNRGLFNLTLGGLDIGFPIVNSLTGLMTIMPEAALVMNSVPGKLNPYYDLMMMQSKRGPMPVSFLSPFRAMTRGFNLLRKAAYSEDAELVQDIIRAREEGIIGKPVIAEIREFGEIAAEKMKAKNPIEAVMQFNEGLIGKTEELSRAWAFVTGRDIAMNVLNMNRAEAFELARRFVSRTMYEYTAGDRARVTTGAIGGGWGLFKNWSMHYIGNMMAYSNEAIWKNNWGPVLWALIGAGSVGGAAAMPGYGVASSFAKLLTDKDLTDWTYDAAGYGGKIGTGFADAFNYGLPSVLGMTLQGRSSAPGSQVIRDTSLFLNMAVVDRGVGLYRFMQNAWDQMADGNVNVMSDRRVQRTFMQAFAPRTIQRAYTYWGGQGLESLRTGNRLINRISKTDAFMHALGITPLEVERTFDAASDLYEDTAKLRGRIQFYGESFSDAWSNGDFDEMRRIYRRAYAEGLPIDSIQRSAQSRRQKDQDDLLQRQFDDLIVQRKKKLRGF